MSLLDAYYLMIDKECQQLQLDNLSLLKNSFTNAWDNLKNSNLSDVKNKILDSISDTPLFDLAENWVAEQVLQGAQGIVGEAMGALTGAVAGPLAAASNAAFSAVAATMMIQQELIYFFAMKAAEGIVETINGPKDKPTKGMRANLTNLQDAIRRLHNALMALSHTGDFYNQYLEGLRKALEHLVNAYNSLERVKSGFIATDKFQVALYESVKADVEAAADLLLPKPKKPDVATRTAMSQDPAITKPVNTGDKKLDAKLNKLKKDISESGATTLPPTLGVQTTLTSQYMALQAMWEIPKLVLDMMRAYDKYAFFVFELNAKISVFEKISAPDVKMFSFFKNYIIKLLDKSISTCEGIVHEMALAMNGSETALDPIEGFKPVTMTLCAKSPFWGVGVKTLRIMLDMIDVNSLGKMNEGNALKELHLKAVESLSKLDNIKGQGVLLRRENAKEEVGDLEPYILKLATQSTLCLVDKTLLKKNPNGLYSSNTVIAASGRATERIKLSLQSCDEIVAIMQSYISNTKAILDKSALMALGNSLLGVADQFGLDKLKDKLLGGDVAAVFSMSAAGATYVGAALSSLYGVIGLLSDDSSRKCVEEVINDLKTKQRSKELQMSRTAAKSAKEQIDRNDETCSDLKKKRKKVEKCAQGGGLNLTGDLPKTISEKITSIMTGLMGDDTAGSLQPDMQPGVSSAPPTTTFASLMQA